MSVDLVLRCVSGVTELAFLAGMLYFGFILMRSRRGRPAVVFFWAVACQVAAVALIAVMSVVMRLFGYTMMNWMGGGSVDWPRVISSILEGTLLLGGFVAAVALVMVTARGRR